MPASASIVGRQPSKIAEIPSEYLAPLAHVGTVFDETPLSIAEKLGETQKIRPLFG